VTAVVVALSGYGIIAAGGHGTLALWNSDAQVPGGEILAGNLDVENMPMHSCDSGTPADEDVLWTLGKYDSSGEFQPGTQTGYLPFDSTATPPVLTGGETAVPLVPKDGVVEFQQCFEVDLHGDNLAAHLDLAGPSTDLDGVENIYATATYTYDEQSDTKSGYLVENGARVDTGDLRDNIHADSPADRVIDVWVKTYVQPGGSTDRFWGIPWAAAPGYDGCPPDTTPQGNLCIGASTEHGASATIDPVKLTATQWREP
jgi:hypothetical protein